MGDAIVSSYRCDRCDRYFAEAELKRVRLGTGFLKACPVCNETVRAEASRVGRSLPLLLAGAFGYPFRGTTLLWVAVLFVASFAMRILPVVGGIFAASAEVALLFAVFKSTADGHEQLHVEVSDLTDRSQWLTPLLKYLSAVAVSFLPALLVRIALSGFSLHGEPSLLVIALALLGLVYFPAALVVAARAEGCLGAFNPVAGVALIALIPGPYAVTVAFLAVAVGVGVGVVVAVSSLDSVIVTALVRGIVQLYVPLVAMRMLGLLVNEHAEDL
jgi:hypothetical protein